VVLNKEIVVECREVSKRYKSGDGLVRALDSVNLQVFGGEMFMLVGPSGCGKTSLISIIACILSYDSGSVVVCGMDLKTLSGRARAKLRQRNIGFVFQSYNLIPSLTAVENVAIPLVTGGMSLRKACMQAYPLLERVGLNGKERSFPSQLSGGQQQRVAIARSIIHRPKLIVCDEPTSALDHRNGELSMELLKEESRSSGCTIIVVTHDNRIFHHGDRIATMNDGKIESVKNKKEETSDNS